MDSISVLRDEQTRLEAAYFWERSSAEFTEHHGSPPETPKWRVTLGGFLERHLSKRTLCRIGMHATVIAFPGWPLECFRCKKEF